MKQSCKADNIRPPAPPPPTFFFKKILVFQIPLRKIFLFFVFSKKKGEESN
jgi:hypothetical protein